MGWKQEALRDLFWFILVSWSHHMAMIDAEKKPPGVREAEPKS